MNPFHQPSEHTCDEQRCAAALLRLLQEPITIEQFCKKPSLSYTSISSAAILPGVLAKLTIAIARLHRAGPMSKRRSEAFWSFTAGSWSRARFNEEVAEARKKLPKTLSAEEDLFKAKGLVDEAIVMLMKGDIRDARDLEAAKRAFERGTLW